MEAGVFNWIGGDTHLYVTHKDAVATQLSRTPNEEKPDVALSNSIVWDAIANGEADFDSVSVDDFIVLDYNPQAPIKAELSVGV